MPAAAPTAPPRRRKELTKKDISEPYDFVHTAHVGLDFKSEDVRNAIKPVASAGRLSSSDHVYESVNRQQETPILVAGSKKEEISPPIEMAPEYVSLKAPSSSSMPAKPAPVAPTGQEDVVDYMNRPSQHIYQNLGTEKPRPSKKKNPPPPPPPQAAKPKIETPQCVEKEPAVVLRKTSKDQRTNEIPPEEMCRIDTPKRVEAVPVSVVIERPGMLGEMRLGLDDPIPLTTGVASSKYRSPSMLTPEKPKEMAVDVPTPMRTPDPVNIEKEQQRKSKAHLVKEPAIDVPPTPSAVAEPQKIILPEPIPVEQKRSASTSPVMTAEEPQEPAGRPVFVPGNAARANPLLKNVISELKTKQSKDDIVEEEEEHEYVTVTGFRVGQGIVENGAAPKSGNERQSVLNTEYVKLKKTEPETKESVPVEEVTPTNPTTVQENANAVEAPASAIPSTKKPSLKKEPTKMKQVALDKEDSENGKLAPIPVPKPRRTVGVSFDSKNEEDEENKMKGTSDDGVDTGYSDEEAEIIRL